MQRVTPIERLRAQHRAEKGVCRIDRKLKGADLRRALIAEGLIMPAGLDKYDVFNTDDVGRKEAAHAIFFDEDRGVAESVRIGYGCDPRVVEEIVVLLRIAEVAKETRDFSQINAIQERHRFKARVWKQLFPASADNGGMS